MQLRPAARLAYRIAQLLLVLLVVGFWFHTSELDASVAGKYSTEYLNLLVGVTLGSGLFGWLYLWFLFGEQTIQLRRGPVRVPLWIKLATTLLVLVLVWIPTEIIFNRIHARQSKSSAAVFHPYLQNVPRPTKKEYLRINRWGYRGEDIEKKKPANTFRIFVLGGSTVYCDRVSFEQSHARVMQRALQAAYPNRTVEVQNAGMHWHTSEHSLIKFLTDIQDFDPDMIVVFHGINDLERSLSPPSYAEGDYRADYGHYYGGVARMVESYGGGAPLVNSLVLKTIETFFSRYWFSDFRAGGVVPEQRVAEWPSLAAFRRNMRDLAEVILRKRIHLVMASQPYFYKPEMTAEEIGHLELTNSMCRDRDFRPDRPSLIAGMDSFNTASRQIAADLNVPFVDLEAAVPKTLDYFADDVHYRPAGNQRVGETLAQAIIDLDIVGARDSKVDDNSHE